MCHLNNIDLHDSPPLTLLEKQSPKNFSSSKVSVKLVMVSRSDDFQI